MRLSLQLRAAAGLLLLVLAGTAVASSDPLLERDGNGDAATSEAEPRSEPESKPAEPASRAQPSHFQQWTFWIVQQQRSLHRSLSRTMENVDEYRTWRHVWTLVALSFLYGVFHAAGPGHGKVVITTYMLTQPSTLKRGILLSVAAALMQGVTAIVLVLTIVFGLGMLAREAVSSVQIVERLSFALIAALGALLLWRALAPLWSRYRARCDHHHADTHGAGRTAGSACSECGGHHHVPPDQAATNTALQNVGLVVSIGARPCTGAVLVLVVANLLGLWWAGVLGVLAMSLGTALTVSTLATLAVTARGTASRLLGFNDRVLAGVSLSLAGIGGALLLLIGISLLVTSLTTRQPFGLL